MNGDTAARTVRGPCETDPAREEPIRILPYGQWSRGRVAGCAALLAACGASDEESRAKDGAAPSPFRKS